MVVQYANFLAERGYKVILWYNTINTVFTLHPQIKLTKIPFPTKLGTIIHSLVKKFHSDAIIVDIIPLASLLSIRNRSRLIYFAQDYDESYYRNSLKRFLIRNLYFYCLSLMRIKVIAVSNELVRELIEKYKASATLVENGIDLETFYPDPDEKLSIIKGNRKAVIVLSRKDYRKGLDIVVKVINKLSYDLKTKIEVWACGETLENEIMNTKVKNFGWLGIQELRKILTAADVFFYPTRHEGFPLMPLEAMACGCPVVTTRAVPYVRNADNALVTDVEDTDNLKEKLETILRDGVLREKLRKNGYETAKKYNLKDSQKQFEKAIADILGFNSNPSSIIQKKASSS
ncbi:MAG TPA: glycosyltransferase family 4 protein [Thermodesulfobacteriota bacterium]